MSKDTAWFHYDHHRKQGFSFHDVCTRGVSIWAAIGDDAQLVIVHAEKHYGEPACAHVVVEELALEDDRPLGITETERGV